MMKRQIDSIYLHCAAGGKDGIPYLGNVLAIHKFHREVNKWKYGIGYHYVILNGRPHNPDEYIQALDGSIETGRPLSSKGAHVYGYNDNSVGMCFIGQSDEQTIRQLMASKSLINWLRQKYDIDIDRIKGHGEIDLRKELCPGMDMDIYRGFIQDHNRLQELI